MKVRVEEVSPIERKLHIEVEPTRVAEELSRAYQTLGRQVKVAGFRPGKVPRRILEQRFKDQVEDEVAHRVMERAYLEAIREHKVDVVSSPEVTNQGLKPDAPFAFEAKVEIRPKLEPKDYKGVALKKVDVKVDDAKVDEQLKQMQESSARLEPVQGRDVAKAGDYATVDYTATIDGKPFTGSSAESITVEVAPGEVVESKVAGLEGVKVGEKKDIDYAFPADYGVDEVKGKTARFTFTVQGLKERVTPELNDDFAKDMNVGATTLAELKEKIRADLLRAQKSEADREQREALVASLIEKNSFDVPKAMIERALDVMLDGALRSLARSGIDPRYMNLDFQKLREEMKPRAEKEVRGSLLFEAIAEKENITATDQEIDARIAEIAEEAGQPLSTVRKHFKDPEERRGLSLRLREEKTIEFLKSQATYS